VNAPVVEFALGPWLEAEIGHVEAALVRAVDRLGALLPGTLLEPARYGVMTGGKRLRPVLCVAAFRAAGGEEPADGEALHDLAAAPELIHAYSLMHDDLPCMDDAPLRRGRPTPHRIYGEGAATLAGAALIPAAGLRAWEAMQRLHPDPEVGREVVRTLLRAAGAGGMVGGQVLDLLGEGRSLGGDELDALHARKTGALLTAALRMGALAAGATPVRVSGFERYGRAIGLAFQVQDDVLDATAGVETLGKAPSDTELGKSTYVALHGVEEAGRLARVLVDEALSALDDLGVASPELRALARYVVDRDR